MSLSSNLQSPEVVLLARIGRQDTAALQEFHTLYARPLYSWALKTLGNPEDAEEALQDAFKRYWEKAVTFDASRAKPFTWAIMILRGICIDHLRKRGRQSKNRLQWLQESTQIDYVLPEVEETASDDTLRVLKAFAALPVRERKAIEMAVFMEVPHLEIAGETGEPLGTVKSRIRRGLLRLRQVLKHHD
jgi:RNA polymerase sigma-70 factor, ECF subfamily